MFLMNLHGERYKAIQIHTPWSKRYVLFQNNNTNPGRRCTFSRSLLSLSKVVYLKSCLCFSVFKYLRRISNLKIKTLCHLKTIMKK